MRSERTSLRKVEFVQLEEALYHQALEATKRALVIARGDILYGVLKLLIAGLPGTRDVQL